MNCFKIFGLSSSREYAQEIADYLDIPLSNHTEYYFDDKEPFVKSDVNVRGCDIYVIQSLYTDTEESINDKFVKLLTFIGSLRDASAKRITLVIPYLGYSRQDRKTTSRAPISTKYVAQLIEGGPQPMAGVDRLLTIDVHNLSAFQNAFRIPTDNLEAKNLLAYRIADLAVEHKCEQFLTVLTPDSGGTTRAKRFRNTLEKELKVKINLAHLDKNHEGRLITGDKIIGDVNNRQVIIVDDMIAGGSTIRVANDAIVAHGGQTFAVCATHGLFVGEKVNENLKNIARIITTDTIKPWCLSAEVLTRVEFISTTTLFAKAIRRIHDEGGSISELLE